MATQLTNYIFCGDLLQDKNITLHVAPDLPKVKAKRDKITCEVTSLKYLYEPAVYAFKKIIETAIKDECCEEVSFDVSGFSEDKVELVEDIVSAVGFTCEKRGKEPFWMGGRFTSSSHYTEYEDGSSTLTFQLDSNLTKNIYELAHSGKEEIDLVDIAIFHCQKEIKRLAEEIK